MTPEAERVIKIARIDKQQKEAERLKDYVAMTMDNICPNCAISVNSFRCGFLWSCLSYICPKCGKRQDTYPEEGVC